MGERTRRGRNIFGRGKDPARLAASLAPAEEQAASRHRNGDGAAHAEGAATPSPREVLGAGKRSRFLRPRAILIATTLLLAYTIFVAWLIATTPPKKPRPVRFVNPVNRQK